MIKSIYNCYLLYSFSLFGIVGMQIDNTLILADNNFAYIKEDAIRSAKIMTKNRKHLTFIHSLKFNDAQIKLNLNKIVLIKESYVGGILPVIDYITDSTNFREIIRNKLSPKE